MCSFGMNLHPKGPAAAVELTWYRFVLWLIESARLQLRRIHLH